MRAFCPAGPTSKISMSSGKVWLIPVRFTVTFVMLPPSPDTGIFDGYGEPAALSLIVIVDVFEKLAGVHDGVPVAVAVAVGEFVGVFVGVFVGPAVGVFVGVPVGPAVGVFVGVFVGVPVGVKVGVFVGVPVTVGVGVGPVPNEMTTFDSGDGKLPQTVFCALFLLVVRSTSVLPSRCRRFNLLKAAVSVI